MTQATNIPVAANNFDAALERFKTVLRPATQSSLHDVASHYATHKLISNHTHLKTVEVADIQAKLNAVPKAKRDVVHENASIELDFMREDLDDHQKNLYKAQTSYNTVKEHISNADIFLKDPKTKQALTEVYTQTAQEHNPAVAEGLLHRAIREIADEQQDYRPEYDSHVRHMLAENRKDSQVFFNPLYEEVETAYLEGLSAHNSIIKKLSTQVHEAIQPKSEKGISARLKREKNLISNAWEGLDSRTGEAMQFGKARVAAGGAFMLGSAALGLHDIYVGVVGGTDEATHQKKDANFSKVAIGVGELALGALLARKVATGSSFAR